MRPWHDAHGDVRFLMDQTGAVTDTYDYDAWGNLINSTGSTPNVYLYRGEQYDPDLNLYYLRARYFNPLTGRFLTRDPAEGTIIDPRTLHKYLYTGADPVNWIDPLGRQDMIEVSDLESITITFGHGARHLAGTAITQAEAESAITAAARAWLANNSMLPQQFLAYLPVKDVGLIIRVFFVTAVWLNIGTYYPVWPVP